MKKLKFLALIPGLVVAFCLGASIAAFREPARGSLISKVGDAGVQLPDWTLLDGQAFTMEYLDNYIFKDSKVPAPDHFLLLTEGLVSKKLAVAIDSLKGHPLSEEPAYRYRQLHPELYRLEMRLGNVPVMVRLDNTEQTAFLVRGDSLATVALTNGDPEAMPIDEFNHMIGSWKWK